MADATLYRGNLRQRQQGGPKDSGKRLLDDYDIVIERSVPEVITKRASFLGGLVSSMIFTLLVGYSTAKYTEVCAIDDRGVSLTTPSFCEAHPTGFTGVFPNYAANIGLIAMSVMVARYAAMSVTGEWSQGDMSPEFTLLRCATAKFVKTEATAYANRAWAIFGQLIGAFVGALGVFACLGNNSRYFASNVGTGDHLHYFKSGDGMGASVVSITGHHNGWATVCLLFFTVLIRALVFLWEHDKSNWESPARGGNWLHKALAVLWCHLKSLSVALVDGGLVLFSGPSFGPAGFFAKDLALHTLMVVSGYIADPLESQFNIWALVYGWGTAALITAFFFFYLPMKSANISSTTSKAATAAAFAAAEKETARMNKKLSTA